MSSDFLHIKKSLPTLGVGLGLRREIAGETFENSESIDWLEFVPENYMRLGGMAAERLETAQALFPLVSHGVNLSIGSTDELNKEYLNALKELLDRLNAPWWSDHLCFTSIDKKYMHDLLPLPFTREAVKHLAQRIKRVQDYIQRPFLIENISYYMNMPGCQMSDGQFLAEVVEAADCGILLDVNNVYVNSVNHQFDPIDYLKEIPIDRTVQMHVAGHKRIGDYVIDTHGAALIEPVYQLLQYVLSKTKVHAVLLERDQNFPEFSELLDELNHIRAIAQPVQPDLIAPKKLKTPATKSARRHEERQSQTKGGRDLRALSA
jgi:uncharacterized protein (UPF0276 family)